MYLKMILPKCSHIISAVLLLLSVFIFRDVLNLSARNLAVDSGAVDALKCNSIFEDEGASRSKVSAFQLATRTAAPSNTLPPPLKTLAFSFSRTTSRLLHLLAGTLVGTLFSEQVGSCGGGAGGCALGSARPFDASARRGGRDWPVVGHTMVGELRLQNVREALEAAVRLRVPGDFAELGVWRGGVCIYAKAILDELCEGRGSTSIVPATTANRDVILFDVFDSMAGYGANTDYLAVSEALVRGAFEKYGVGTDGVVFVKGLFKDTLPEFRNQRIRAGGKPIAVLRIDGNYYDSHQDALYYLYDFVPVDGIIIFDDYSHELPRLSWDDFMADQKFFEKVTPIEAPDSNGGWFVKTVDVKVDFSKMRAPRDCNKR